MDILSIGSSQANFLKELYGQVSTRSKKQFLFTLTGEKKFSSDVKYTGEDLIRYEKLDQYIPKVPVSRWKLFYLLFTDPKIFYHDISLKEEIAFLIFKNKLSFKRTIDELKIILLERYQGNKYIRPLFEKYPIVQVHFLILSNIKYAWYIPSTTKLICTFWGSDVLRFAGVENQFYISKLLKKADVITSQSLEMREFILTKYGRNFRQKFRTAMFALPDAVFEIIDSQLDREEAKVNFCKKHGLSPDKINIVIGHNGSVFNNHLEIFKSLIESDQLNLDNYNIIFPFTYMPEGPKMKLKLSSLIDAYTNCIILEDYMTWQELAELRLSTDFYIHAPQSDAMSGALTEAIYAGAIPIVGSWLPYQNYNRIGVVLTKFDNFDEIPQLIMKNYKTQDSSREIINANLRGNVITDNWIRIYKTLQS